MGREKDDGGRWETGEREGGRESRSMLAFRAGYIQFVNLLTVYCFDWLMVAKNCLCILSALRPLVKSMLCKLNSLNK